MKRSSVDIFERVVTQLAHLHEEMSTLAKKSPDGATNTFKLGFINAILAECNGFLGVPYRAFADFEQFSADDVPTNSDVTFILSQYIACAEIFRAANVYRVHSQWYWDIDGVDRDNSAAEGIMTSPPVKLRQK